MTPHASARSAPDDRGSRRCAVWGSPIGHSLSPVLHRAAYAVLGLEGWTYERREVDEQGFEAALAGLDGTWRGLSLTMPLKEVGLRRAVTVSDTARATGGANTLVRHDDGWHAHNTDVYGIRASLAEALPRGVEPWCALVVGSGATARSAVAALAESGVQKVAFMVRGAVRPETVAQAERTGLMVAVVPWGTWPPCDIVVSTVPPSAVAGLDDFPSPPQTGSGAVLDVVYGAGETALERVAQDRGWRRARGVDMLLHQATEQVRLMTGRSAPVEAMREALREALGGERGGALPEELGEASRSSASGQVPPKTPKTPKT
ncbi:MAG: shikimate dehydrogenase [Humibacillus sp.]|nr:shikimate dehydrogenase [Humibacillus sp.]MDN5776474.1 shikimate dehydrogenase [Humibacillus sp.]